MRGSRRCHTRSGRLRRRVLPLPLRLASQDHERGGLSLMMVILFVPLAALAGVVVDGSAKLEAGQNAVALAQEAARAGAAAVDRSSAYSSGSFVVDQQQALRAASGYLSSAGYGQYTVAAAGTRAIQVSVTITEQTRFLSLIGVDSFTCTGSATASLVTGVTRGTS
jgi:Flp pilus assembly protein TadG